MEQAFFPMFYNIAGKKIIVAGAGNIAERRVKTLLQFSCEILVVAPEGTAAIHEWADKQLLVWEKRSWEARDLAGAFFVIAATDDKAINDGIAADCRSFGIPVNHAGDKEQCSFYFPGIVMEENIILGITASGKNHKQAREITEKVRKLIREESSE